ncbi:MAG: hypothetical protein AAF636_04700 [Pseudomonadota bacterium]
MTDMVLKDPARSGATSSVSPWRDGLKNTVSDDFRFKERPWTGVQAQIELSEPQRPNNQSPPAPDHHRAVSGVSEQEGRGCWHDHVH